MQSSVLIPYKDYDIALSYSSKCFHDSEETSSENLSNPSRVTHLWAEACQASRSLSPAAPQPVCLHWPCVPDGLHMLRYEHASREIWNVCLISDGEDSVLGENPLVPWTCLFRHICIMMTISNYTESFNLKALKPLLDCKYTSPSVWLCESLCRLQHHGGA